MYAVCKSTAYGMTDGGTCVCSFDPLPFPGNNPILFCNFQTSSSEHQKDN